MKLLAGYISGTGVELAHVKPDGNRPILYDRASFASRDFGNLESVLRKYIKEHGGGSSAACFGVCGPVICDEVSATNLKWHIASDKLRQEFDINSVKLVNDIVATAHGLSYLNDDKFYTLNEGRPVEGGNVGLIAAGSGLGEALIVSDGKRTYPYASEGGHADFAPGSQVEAELWEYLYAEKGQVEVEDVVSARGLVSIYLFLLDSTGEQPAPWFEKAKHRADAIIECALAGKDEHASRAVNLFVDCYASEAANLALKGMTLGGVFIGGSLAPQILTLLDDGRFMQRFIKHGKMENLLERVPVGVIIEDKTALLGAAGLALTMMS